MLNRRLNKIDYVFHREKLFKPQPSKDSTRQYPSMLAKYAKVDDLRETMRDIVEKKETFVKDTQPIKPTINLKMSSISKQLSPA